MREKDECVCVLLEPYRSHTRGKKVVGGRLVGDGVCEVAEEGGSGVMECWSAGWREGGGDECVLTV